MPAKRPAAVAASEAPMPHNDDEDSTPHETTALVPVPDREHLPMPVLPSSSGATWGSRLRIAKKDTAYVRQHLDYLNARVAQSNAMTALIESRIGVAVSMSKLAAV